MRGVQPRRSVHRDGIEGQVGADPGCKDRPGRCDAPRDTRGSVRERGVRAPTGGAW